MQHKTISFDSGQPGTHHYHQWMPDNTKPIAWLHIMHGMSEHSARYAHFAEFLNQQGIMVTAGDHRGHGLTGSSADSLYHMGDNDSWNQMVNDQWQLTNHIAAEQQLPLVILGHSMGSFMATQFCQQYAQQLHDKHSGRLAGLILSGSNYDSPTTFKVAAGAAWIERARLGGRNISNFLEQLSFGSFNRSFKPARTDKDWLSSDENAVDTYIADPWCGGALSTQSWYDFMNGLAKLSQPKSMAQINADLPIYVLSGDLDPVGGRGKGVVKLQSALQQAGVKQVDLKLYEGGRHEMLNETNRQQVYQDILRWLKKALENNA